MKKLGLIFCIFGLFAVSSFAQQEVNNGFEKVKQHDVLIYPNPMMGEQFTVKSSSAISKVEVVNVIGKVIKRVENNDLALKEIPVLVGKQEKGLYLIKVSFEDDKTVIKKLLVK
jgi:uncharacterized protein YdeI (BOF family)